MSGDYIDDTIMVYHESKSLDFTLKVAKLAMYLEREPSMISRSKNFTKAYDFFESLSLLDRHNNEAVKSKIIRDLNSGLNKK